jgi:carbohydrate diacid regulator
MTEETTEKLLQQLQQETGIAFMIRPGEEQQELEERLRKLLKTLQAAGNRGTFLKQVFMGQVQETELETGCKRFHLPLQERRGLVLIRFEKPYTSLELSVLGNIYNPSVCDVVPVDERDVVVLRVLSAKRKEESLPVTAEHIYSILQSEVPQNVSLSYDETTEEISGLPGCYRNTLLAMKVGETFYRDRHILAYGELGLGTLLCQLPEEACRQYLDKTLPGLDFRKLDAETINTIKTFLDCDLNIAETARALYMHRNTLVYRLDTIKKLTGLDIRRFEDALDFRIALLLWEMTGR